MAALARIVQMVGWLWVIAGLVLPALGLADPSFFPGVILIFIARALRAQAARHAPPEEPEEQIVEAERVLNTERTRPQPIPTPAKTPQPGPSQDSRKTEQEPVADALKRTARDDLIERIAMAGREAGERSPEVAKSDVTTPTTGEERQGPMSSAEMIARARKRWDNKS